jgi:hypothetical protein
MAQNRTKELKADGEIVFFIPVSGKLLDQGDAKWILIRGHLRGHNDTPFERPTPGWPIGRPGFVFDVFLITIDY